MELTPAQLKKKEENKRYYDKNKDKWKNINNKSPTTPPKTPPKTSTATPTATPSAPPPSPSPAEPDFTPLPSNMILSREHMLEWEIKMLKIQNHMYKVQIDEFKQLLQPLINALGKST